MKKIHSRILRVLVAAMILAAAVLMGCGDEYYDGPDSTETYEVVTEAAAETDTEAAAEEETTQAETQQIETETEEILTEAETEAAAGVEVTEDGTYTSKEEVALYIHLYGKLPSNYITKKDAEALGWESSKGNLWDVAYGKSIGGSKFGNYEGSLPDANGRKYYECDINYEGGYRGSERIIYSNDGLVFYTNDHYETFEQLY